jgi:hypothetical protein
LALFLAAVGRFTNWVNKLRQDRRTELQRVTQAEIKAEPALTYDISL